MGEIFKPAFVLLTICVVVTVLLALVYNGTKPIIAQRAAADLALAKKEVLPGADAFTDLTLPPGFATDEALATVRTVSRGTRSGTFEGLVVNVVSRGYDASGVHLTVGIDATGTLTGIHVGDNLETPGLGTKVLGVDQPYLKQFQGLKPSGDLILVKNKKPGDPAESIDAVTGVTFTSRAVWRGVQGALEASRRTTPEGGLK